MVRGRGKNPPSQSETSSNQPWTFEFRKATQMHKLSKNGQHDLVPSGSFTDLGLPAKLLDG